MSGRRARALKNPTSAGSIEQGHTLWASRGQREYSEHQDPSFRGYTPKEKKGSRTEMEW